MGSLDKFRNKIKLWVTK